MIKIVYGILIFCSIHSINTMQSEDYYHPDPLPQLYTNQNGIGNLITIDTWNTPFINTISINNRFTRNDYFSISLFKYEQNTFPFFNHNLPYDAVIQNSIIDNPERVVMAQKKDNENIIFIPIEQTKKEDFIENKNILALALMAGYSHFKINQAHITLNETDFEIWKKLFKDFTESKNQLPSELSQTYFSLNLTGSNINMMPHLISFLRENFNADEIQTTLSTYPKKEQPNQLNHFLTTGEFQEENRSNKFYQTIYKYLTFKKVKDTLYQNFFRPIYNWYDYFARSIRFWKNVVFRS